jgi:hypothetical protein
MDVSAEKRRADRIEIEFPAVCTRFNSDTGHPVTVKNCSEGGMYFEGEKPFGAGLYIMLRKDGSLKGATPPGCPCVKSLIVGQVRWSREIPTSTGFSYGVGVRYVHSY